LDALYFFLNYKLSIETYRYELVLTNSKGRKEKFLLVVIRRNFRMEKKKRTKCWTFTIFGVLNLIMSILLVLF